MVVVDESGSKSLVQRKVSSFLKAKLSSTRLLVQSETNSHQCTVVIHVRSCALDANWLCSAYMTYSVTGALVLYAMTIVQSTLEHIESL